MVLILLAQSQASLRALAGLCAQHLYRSMLLQSWSHGYLITILELHCLTYILYIYIYSYKYVAYL